MDDALDEGGSLVASGTAAVRVNGRRVSFDLTSGEIIKGPPAILGKYVCHEQMADVIEAGSYVGRLCTADRPEDLRLAEAEYRFLRPKERKMRAPLEKGISVRYGDRGTFRVIDWAGGSAQSVVLEAADGKKIAVPMQRYLNEAEVVAAIPAREPATPASEQRDPYMQPAGEGLVHLDEADIDRALQDRLKVILESDEFVKAVTDRVADVISERLATTFANEGQQPPGDPANSSGNSGDSTA